MDIKCADFVYRSTITHIASWPFFVLGRPTMKSIVIWSHFHSGISSGCSSPPGRWCSVLTFWQVRHLATYSATYFFIPDHQNHSFKSWYILVAPRWTEYGVVYSSERSFSFSWASLGVHNLPLKCRIPSVDTLNSTFFPTNTCSFNFRSCGSSSYAPLIPSKTVSWRIKVESCPLIISISNFWMSFCSISCIIWMDITVAIDFQLRACAI